MSMIVHPTKEDSPLIEFMRIIGVGVYKMFTYTSFFQVILAFCGGFGVFYSDLPIILKLCLSALGVLCLVGFWLVRQGTPIVITPQEPRTTRQFCMDMSITLLNTLLAMGKITFVIIKIIVTLIIIAALIAACPIPLMPILVALVGIGIVCVLWA